MTKIFLLGEIQNQKYIACHKSLGKTSAPLMFSFDKINDSNKDGYLQLIGNIGHFLII